MAIEFRLKKQGFDVTICEKDMNLRKELIKEKPEVVIIDLDAREGSGLDLVSTVRADRPSSGVLLLADPDEEERILEGFKLGIRDFISKPFKPAELLLRVQRIAEEI